MIKLLAMLAVFTGFAVASETAPTQDSTPQKQCEDAGNEWKDNACVPKTEQ